MTDTNGQNTTGRQTKVFLAGPFKALVDPATGRMRDFDKNRYEALIELLESRGHSVHNAHKRESWGAQFMSPEECTALDHKEIAACDLFIAFPGAPPSPGTHIEIGWASALGKPIMLLLEPEQTYAFLVRGLHTVADVTYVTMPTDRTGVEEFAEALTDLEERAGLRAPAGR